jgi:hypothetical protein
MSNKKPMSSKKPMNTTKQSDLTEPSHRVLDERLVPKALAERLDSPPDHNNEGESGCRLRSVTKGTKLYWPSPVFTRLAIDTPSDEALCASLERMRRQCGISVVLPEHRDDEESTMRTGGMQQAMDRSLDDGISIIPILVDEPCALRALMHAEQMELQFFRSRLHSKTPAKANANADSFLADAWIPILPSDLMQVDDLAKRVELFRSVSDQPSVVVGGCIAAGSIYHDVRYLIDSGLDYICLLTDVVGGLMPARHWHFQSTQHAIGEANRAIADSGIGDFSLLISGAFDRLEQPLEWLADGVCAFSIDYYLAQQNPGASALANHGSADAFGSFLGGYPSTPLQSYDWLLSSAQQWLTEWSGLRRFFNAN